MKKLSLIIAFIIALSNLTFAQKSKKGASPDIDVPSPVMKTFNTKYKLAKKTVWTQEEETYRADFKLNDLNMAVAYSSDGKMLYTEKDMPKTQYNKTALKYITENYAGYKITDMRKRDTYDKKTTYITTLRKSREILEVEFDKKGGFIRDTDKTPASASSKKKAKKEADEETTDEETKPAKKEAKVKDKKKTNDDEESDEEAAPAKKETKAKPAPKKSNDDDAEEAAPAPAPKKETKAKPAPKKTTEDDEEEDAKPAPKKEKEKAKPAPKKEKKKTTDDDDDE